MPFACLFARLFIFDFQKKIWVTTNYGFARHIAVAEWSKRPTCFRLVGSFVGSNLGRGSIIS